MTSPTFTNLNLLRNQLQKHRNDSQSIAFVPSLGGLHEGHASLIRIASAKAQKVVVSLFLNTPQFNNKNDLENYPNSLKDDKDFINNLKCPTLIYVPSHNDIYPPDFSTLVSLPALEKQLCGAHRPQHFAAVATIVTKLLLQILPDYAVFGGKDFQQLRIIRQLVKDLDIPTHIIGAPTVREHDGLAFSSRNLMLSETQRAIAPLLYKTISELAKIAASGANMDKPSKEAEQKLISHGFSSVDYIGLFSEKSLEKMEKINLDILPHHGRIFGAASLGEVRIIDNVGIHCLEEA
jgi:pantoate--beta-alanine ligase